jgi:hypothetical protein
MSIYELTGEGNVRLKVLRRRIMGEIMAFGGFSGRRKVHRD